MLLLALNIFGSHPDIESLPNKDDLQNKFIFRASLCIFLQIILWISQGNTENHKIEAIRNAIIDAYIVAYSTYYDGLLTDDYNAKMIRAGATYLLKEFFLK